MSDKFDTYVEAGRTLIEQHPDYTSLTTEGDEDDRKGGFESAATDQIATILHGVLGRDVDSVLAQDLLDRALRCFEGDYEDMHTDAVGDEITPVVVVIRDPDFSNEFHTFGGVEYYDIDAGHDDLKDPREYREWVEGHEQAAARFEREGHPEIAALIRDTISNYGPDA